MSNGVLDWWRNATPEQKAQRRAEMAAERAEQEARREAEAAEYRARRNYWLSDEGLNATIAHGGYGPGGGAVHPRQARPLLRLATVAQRERAFREASTRQNLSGGILSDNIHYVVNDMLRAIADGREAEELYGERTAREYREAEEARRAAELKAVAARFQRGG